MRQVVLDTETTGLDPLQGHRIIEIGCREIINRRLTERYFHHYLQPDQRIDPGAMEIHGISNEFLADKPRFGDIAADLIGFLQGAEVIIHNAPFDVGFIDHELKRLGGRWTRLQDYCTILDTLLLARQRHPGQKNSLDALCKRYKVDNSQRDLHGALLDAEILADLYLRMTGGQVSLELTHLNRETPSQHLIPTASAHAAAPRRVVRATEVELAAHQDRLDAIDVASQGQCLWKRLESSRGNS
ncbi:MAG: DNA polymerase III subunit epsilon [Gammaproteobacteria bacterium]